MEGKKVKKRNRSIPHALVIMLIIIVVATILTWIIPGGTYATDANGNMQFGTQYFQSYGVTLKLGIWDMFKHIVNGFYSAKDIIFLVLVAYATLNLLTETGAIDAGIAACARLVKKSPKAAPIIIAAIMLIFAFWATTGTMSYEEILGFIPVFVALALTLGYDPIVGSAMSVIAVGFGFASGVWNAFTTGTAQSIVGIEIFSGSGFRIIVLLVTTATLIAYTLIYAARIKKDPKKSVTYGMDFSDLKLNDERLNTKFTLKRILSLVCLLAMIIAMAIGLAFYNWYIDEIIILFLMLAIALGVVNWWSPNKIAETWTKGICKAAGIAIIIGFARGIIYILSYGCVIYPIVNWCGIILGNFSTWAGSVGIMIFQGLINFFLPSGSAQATVTMPIMSPLSKIIGLGQQACVLAFQFGDGFTNLIWPTNAALIGSILAGVPLNKYYKWFIPLFLIVMVECAIFLGIAIAIGM